MFLRLLTALMICLAIPSAGVLSAAVPSVQEECKKMQAADASCCTGTACCQMNSGTKDATPLPVTAPAASADLKFIPIALRVVGLLAAPQIRENASSRPIADSLTPHAPPPLVRSGIFLI